MTASEIALQYPRGAEIAIPQYHHGKPGRILKAVPAPEIAPQLGPKLQPGVFKPQLIGENMDVIFQKADFLYSFVNLYGVLGCLRHIVLLLG